VPRASWAMSRLDGPAAPKPVPVTVTKTIIADQQFV
jgi:hypothetical protein